jgi:hypothetical protein
MWELSAHAETLLTVIIAAIPNIILAAAAYKKVGRQEHKIDKIQDKTEKIQKQTNGNLIDTTNRMNELASRLSKYETLPTQFRRHDEGNPQSSSGDSGGSNAGGPSGELPGNKDTV